MFSPWPSSAIRQDLAPVVVHVHLDRVGAFLEAPGPDSPGTGEAGQTCQSCQQPAQAFAVVSIALLRPRTPCMLVTAGVGRGHSLRGY